MSELIERQAAIDKIEELQMPIMRSASLIDQCKFDGLGMAREVLIELPSVSTEKTGHNCNEDYADCDQFICSECGIELQDWNRVERDEDDGEISYHEYTFNYCPNCGAKMGEVVDESVDESVDE